MTLTGIPKRLLQAELASRTGDHAEWMPYTDWTRTVAPSFASSEFADHQRKFWEWADHVHTDPELPRVAANLWPRGQAKSTSVEMAAVKWGSEGRAHYALYVCATQDQADDHVGNIGEILESDELAAYCPAMAEKLVGKFGDSKGWRRNRLRTSTGFTVDGMGIDSSARGAKLGKHRPDLIILDDIDDEHDTPQAVDKKIKTLTQKILPAVAKGAVVVMAQNIVHADSVAQRMVTGRTDMMKSALKIGPVPAVTDAVFGQDDTGIWRITGGVPTWPGGMDIDACEALIDLIGLDSFVIESQQEISERRGALWTRALIAQHKLGSYPPLDRVIVAVDPNKTGKRDDAGIVVIGRATPEGSAYPHAYVLADLTQLSRPGEWRDDAAAALLDWQAGAFVVERTGLGDHAELTLKDAPVLLGLPVTVEGVDAKISKQDRAQPVAQLYRDGRVHHVGQFPVVEGQMTSWVPSVSSLSPGGIDALVHGVTHLLLGGGPSAAFTDVNSHWA